MNSIVEKAYAKLNLSLDIRGRHPDGYHEMLMVMQTIDLCDDIKITLNDEGRFTAASNLGFLPADRRNIAAAAAELFLKEAGMEGAGADIVMQKRIPVCAGMGGGSSDAAAVLRALNRLTGAGFSAEKLEAMGLELGSDVPFCVRGGTALASGRGEKLAHAAPLPDCDIVVCKPRFSISTPTLFRLVDGCKLRYHPDTRGLTAALESGSVADVARRMYNVFETVLPRRYVDISAIKSVFMDFGALGTVMTGTGSAVFAIFDNTDTAAQARDALRERYGTAYLAKPVGKVL
ncbi:MAG: 4-(cytidine 5'-diphospho)-2-C-methyl-D-erythritol kinase [Oscillospiraceae bacterium]|nr:4-(cytidine 5'-diphospho)-2-C-methyl-D-erythritol kinase [Oscillospiraceae bacterium]